MKSEFLANMSDEIRTPLYGISGMIDLLKTTQLTIQQEESVEIMFPSAKTLLTLINDILDFSKIEAGEISPEILKVDINSFIEVVIDTFRIEAKKKKVSFNFDFNISQGVEKIYYFKTDPDVIYQVNFQVFGITIMFILSVFHRLYHTD